MDIYNIIINVFTVKIHELSILIQSESSHRTTCQYTGQTLHKKKNHQHIYIYQLQAMLLIS